MEVGGGGGGDGERRTYEGRKAKARILIKKIIFPHM